MSHSSPCAHAATYGKCTSSPFLLLKWQNTFLPPPAFAALSLGEEARVHWTRGEEEAAAATAAEVEGDSISPLA